MTPEIILKAISNDEEMKKFLQGFAYKAPKKEQGLMIRDYCEWRENQEPFVDDREFFKQAYGIDICQFSMDLFKEIYFLRKELDELCDDSE